MYLYQYLLSTLNVTLRKVNDYLITGQLSCLFLYIIDLSSFSVVKGMCLRIRPFLVSMNLWEVIVIPNINGQLLKNLCSSFLVKRKDGLRPLYFEKWRGSEIKDKILELCCNVGQYWRLKVHFFSFSLCLFVDLFFRIVILFRRGLRRRLIGYPLY